MRIATYMFGCICCLAGWLGYQASWQEPGYPRPDFFVSADVCMAVFCVGAVVLVVRILMDLLPQDRP